MIYAHLTVSFFVFSLLLGKNLRKLEVAVPKVQCQYLFLFEDMVDNAKF